MRTTIIAIRTAADGTVLVVYRRAGAFWVGMPPLEHPLPHAQYGTIDDALTRLAAELAQRAQTQEGA